MLRLAFILVLVPAIAGAGEFYQCTAADGSKAFQAIPCPVDSKEEVRELKAATATSSASSRSSALDNSSTDPEAVSCFQSVEKDYEGVPKEIEDYYKRGLRICRENFHDGSSQIKNCFQEQEEVKAEKYEDLERYKAEALEYCAS